MRGEGSRLWDSEGKEYLDFLTGISVCSVGHCHPAVVEAIREQAGTLIHASNLYLTEGGVRLAERHLLVEPRTARRSSATPAPRRMSARSSWPASTPTAGASPSRRSWCSRAPSTAARWAPVSATPGMAANESFAPYLPGFVAVPRRDPDALRAAVGERTAAVMLEPIQGESGHPRDRRGGDRRRPRGLRRRRGAAGVRRDPGRDGEDGIAVGLRAAARPARRADHREGARRRDAGRRLRRRAGPCRHAAGRGPRIHLRGRPAGRGGCAGRLRRDRRPGPAARRARARGQARATGSRRWAG